MDISRIDPWDVDLELAERLAAIGSASLAYAGLAVSPPTGPSLLTGLQYGNNGRPVDALWVVGAPGESIGWAVLELPFLDNLTTATIQATVDPAHRRAGWRTGLLDRQLDLIREHGRASVRTWVWAGTDGISFLEARGFSSAGQHPMAVRRLDLHDDADRFDRIRVEADVAAAGYELVRIAGALPDELVPDLVSLHEAINDAPADEGHEPDVWNADRVRSYDASMARRHQTTYRVLARHTASGEWVGMSLLCVDEFSPTIAFQEDTNVVRAHRGHRLGLLLKCEMVRWIRHDRPEVRATDTWNAADNHHMIAVNERLGCRVIATNVGYRRLL